MKMWRHFFNAGLLSFFDIDSRSVELLNSFNLPLMNFRVMDVTKEDSIRDNLKALPPLDVLLDDSSHVFEDMIRIIKVGLPFIKPGCMIIIEDIHREWDEAKFETALEDVKKEFSFIYFVEPEHERKWSPG